MFVWGYVSGFAACEAFRFRQVGRKKEEREIMLTKNVGKRRRGKIHGGVSPNLTFPFFKLTYLYI